MLKLVSAPLCKALHGLYYFLASSVQLLVGNGGNIRGVCSPWSVWLGPSGDLHREQPGSLVTELTQDPFAIPHLDHWVVFSPVHCSGLV